MPLPILPLANEWHVISLGTAVADLLGIFGGAALGASIAWHKRMDLIGFLVLGLTAGLGGGVIRDVLLQVGPPLALVRPSYVITAVAGALFAFLFEVQGRPHQRLFATVEALTLGMFAVAGVMRTLDAGLPAGTALLLGVISTVGGGVIRDVLAGDPPALLWPGPFFATAAFAASASCLALRHLHLERMTPLAGALVGAALRLLSLRFGWKLPRRAGRDPR